MTMTVAMVDAPIPADAARRAVLTVEMVNALVRAIASGPYRDEGMIFVDDEQVGCDASRVSPAAVELALTKIPEPLVSHTRRAIAPVLAFAKADGWNLWIRSNQDRHWMPGNAPEILLSLERAGAVEASWTVGHTRVAFEDLGFTMDADESIQVPARMLADACQGRSDADSLRLAAIAAYALERGGPDAEVMAA